MYLDQFVIGRIFTAPPVYVNYLVKLVGMLSVQMLSVVVLFSVCLHRQSRGLSGVNDTRDPVYLFSP